MNHTKSPYAVCPYYKQEQSQLIYCQGIPESASTLLSFKDRGQARDYKFKYCRKDYKKCKIAKMLERLEYAKD